MEEEDLFDKIQEMLGKLPEKLNILQEQIDINLQMEYFKAAQKNREKPVKNIIGKKDLLFTGELTKAEKKWLLLQLASIDNVEEFRTIERFVKEGDPELREWAVLAFQESRMIIESSLLDENQVFISTGLGGKGSKLRYFIVLLSKNNQDFSEMQCKIIQSEFNFVFKQSDAELEKIDFLGQITTLLAIIPINVPIKDILTRAVDECNQFGNFIRDDFIVTNVKVLSINEIYDFLKKHNISGN